LKFFAPQRLLGSHRCRQGLLATCIDSPELRR
jgi:hypothetical protein